MHGWRILQPTDTKGNRNGFVRNQENDHSDRAPDNCSHNDQGHGQGTNIFREQIFIYKPKIEHIMKMYISGKIYGLDYADVEQKFNDAEEFLSGLDIEVVNPLKNGLQNDAPWINHICDDIKLLDGCDAIYMLNDWIDSDGAGIEYDIALRTGKDVWFESNVVRNQKNVLKIQNAIHEVTGIHFNEYTTKSRKRDGFFARMLFAKHCSQRMKPMEIATMINRDRTTVLSLLKKYDDEVKYNPYFRVLAQRVENIINKTSNEATKA